MVAFVKCESCRRTLGKELLACPRRDIGAKSTCQYRVEEARMPSTGWGCLLVFGLGAALIPVIAYLIGQGMPLWVKAVLSPALVVGGVSVVGVVYQLFGKQTTIFNPVNGKTWQQTSLLGIPVLHTTTSAIEEIPWSGALARELRYPASVAELYRDGSASDVVSTALLQLMAQGVVSLGVVRITHPLRRVEMLYVLRPGEKFALDSVRGRLETRIRDVVGLSGCPDAAIRFEERDHPRMHRAVLTLEDVLVMVFAGGQPDPRKYLVSELVGVEAEETGLGVVRGIRQKQFAPGPNTRGKIALDIQSIDQLHRDFWTTAPEHAQEVLARIDLLIHSPVVTRHPTVGEKQAKAAAR